MSWVWPRRTSGLAPGQRLLEVMPRFSDNPKKPSPPVPDNVELTIAVDGADRVFDLGQLMALGSDEVTADGYRIVLTQEDARGDEVLVATHPDEEELGSRHGPLRLVSPEQYGYKNLKHLNRIDLRTERPQLGGKEHLRARVDLEERHPKIPGRLLRWPYRLLVPLTVWIAERSEHQARDRLDQAS